MAILMKTLLHMDQRIIDLFDEYTHRPLRRDEFLGRLAKLTGSMVAAMAVLPLLESNYARAAAPLADDLVEEEVSYPGDGVTMKSYLVRPKAAGKRGGVVVIHENRGLTPHIKDVTRRVAAAGYTALGVDALSVFGGTPADEDEGRTKIGQLDKAQNLRNYLLSLRYLRSRADANGKTGCVGFCWGGALANQLAVNDPELDVAVAFYGMQADVAEVPRIKARLQLHYAEKDDRVNAGIAAYEAALKAAGTRYELYTYPGTQHAFHNDTSAARYDEAAAKLAWERTLKAFKETLA